MRLVLLLPILAAAILAGCQVKPTKIVQQGPQIGESVTAENLLKDNPAILDVRPPFEFNLAHVPGSINVRWEDFSQPDPHSRGLLQEDLFSVARRLSLIGIDPDTKVVVLGKGSMGNGEEGRVAWTLQVLGIKNVYTALHGSYREMNPHPSDEEPLIKNKSYWKPAVDDSMMIDMVSFKAYATQKLPQMKYKKKSHHHRPQDLPVSSLFGFNFNEAKGKIVILDVRSPQEYSLQNVAQNKEVKVPVINLEWKSFFGDSGMALKDFDKLLASKKITKESIILVISNHGVRSGAVTYALRQAGFRQVVNFAGGYEQWR